MGCQREAATVESRGCRKRPRGRNTKKSDVLKIRPHKFNNTQPQVEASHVRVLPFCQCPLASVSEATGGCICAEMVYEIPPLTKELSAFLEQEENSQPIRKPRRPSQKKINRVKNAFIAFKCYYFRLFPKHMSLSEVTTVLARAWAIYPYQGIWDQYIHQYNMRPREDTFVTWLNKVPKYSLSASTEQTSVSVISPCYSGPLDGSPQLVGALDETLTMDPSSCVSPIQNTDLNWLLESNGFFESNVQPMEDQFFASSDNFLPLSPLYDNPCAQAPSQIALSEDSSSSLGLQDPRIVHDEYDWDFGIDTAAGQLQSDLPLSLETSRAYTWDHNGCDLAEVAVSY